MMEGMERGGVVWKGGPSQVINFQVFSLCAIIPLLSFPFDRAWANYSGMLKPLESFHGYIIAAFWIIPPLYAFAKWLQVKCRSYVLTDERLSEQSGVFSKITDDLELYRIKDTAIFEPFLLRSFGLGNVVLYTSDRATPIVVIQAVPGVKKLQGIIRDQVEHMRTIKGVREID